MLGLIVLYSPAKDPLCLNADISVIWTEQTPLIHSDTRKVKSVPSELPRCYRDSNSDKTEDLTFLSALR